MSFTLITAPVALTLSPAAASPAGTGLVISEVYGAGGNSGATYNADFVEILNPTSGPVDLLGKYVSYRSSTGSAGGSPIALRGTIPAGQQFLVRMSATGTTGAAITPDQVASPAVSMAAGGGQVFLTSNSQPVTGNGNMAGRAAVIDMVGLDGATSFETASGPTATATLSANRTGAADTDDNSADFALQAPSPAGCGCGYAPQVVGSQTIAAIQGEGDTSPFVYDTATTRGVVTATYPTGGFNGFFLQTEGTGGAADATAGVSDGIFVFGTAAMAANPVIGDFVEVTGAVSEFAGSTQITPAANGVVKINDQAHTAPTALAAAVPTTEAAREAHESELLAPTNRFTVTNTFNTNNFGEIGLATGTTPLIAPTEVADAQDTAAINAIVADNAARAITLDDGASANYIGSASGTAAPWLTASRAVRVGDSATLAAPVVLDWRNSAWKFQPTQQVTGTGTEVVDFTDSRPANQTPQNVGGDLHLATFNVLNYFPTTGEEFDALPGTTCTYFNDRQGNRIGVNSCTPDGPRGAATVVSFERQQAKIVTAINRLGADIVSLEELENSAKYGKDRDFAISTLVDALNAAAGAGTWAFAPSPADRPALSEEDVIRTGFIYKPGAVALVGESRILKDEVNFANAREPLAQAFKPAGSPDSKAFSVVVNHFKSKGSGVDDGTGQGNANPDRVGQAHALVAFAEAFAADRGTDALFLAGDLNSYTMEDPMQVLYSEGFKAIESDTAGEETYSFSGLSGSLDHVLGNRAAIDLVTGADIWNINSPESVAYQYSRYNYNVTQFFDATHPFAASDHDPEIIGIDSGLLGTEQVQLLATNDFHGRLANNSNAEAGAAVLAGAVKQLRAQNPETVFAAAGDLIGASTFDSFIQHDKPTIDALNEAGLEVSAVGNHEFDQGYDDLVNRVMAAYDADSNPYGGAEWQYIGANVKMKATGDPAVPASWIKDFGDVQVGFVGAVTEDLPSLVTPAGIADIEVTDIVTAANTTAADLKSAGADVIVLLVHEGAASTSLAAATDDSAFGRIVNGVDGDIDAIVSGHTHLAYNHAVPVPEWATEGRAVTTRPVVSAGQYGMALNQLQFRVDSVTGDVVGLDQKVLNLETCTSACTSSAPVFTANYPSDPATAQIVSDAVAQANVLGAVRLGDIAGPFNRAKLANGTTENRGGESTAGNLVAEVQRWATESDTSGSAQIAFMNPGGLRADMVGTGTAYPKVLSYKQAAEMQPFANTLVNMRLTGANIKTVLEQQWQRDGSGNVPSRPFLRLGTSKGFTYTYDPALPEGSRITGMWLNGEKIDPAASYSVTVNSFLASGGDNFRAFNQGTNKRDTGKVDLQAMVDYMAAFADTTPLPVDYTQRAVGVSFPAGAPASYAPGSEVAFDLSSLAFSTAADTKDAEVKVSLGATDLGTFPVNNTIGTAVFDEYGTAAVHVTLPGDTPIGGAVLTVTGLTTGTSVRVPVQVAQSASTVSATADPMVYGTPGSVEVSVAPPNSTGSVEVLNGADLLGEATLTDGAATVTIAGTALQPGSHELTVNYLGDSAHEASTTTVTVTVARAVSATTATITPTELKVKKDTARIDVSVAATGTVPTGTVAAFVGGSQVGSGTLTDGHTTFTVGPFATVGTKTVTIRYLGDDHVAASSTTGSITVVKARPKLTLTKSDLVRVQQTRPVLTMTFGEVGFTVPGQVKVTAGGQSWTKWLSDGKARIALPAYRTTGAKEVTVKYLGSRLTERVARTITIRVVR